MKTYKSQYQQNKIFEPFTSGQVLITSKISRLIKSDNV